MAKKVPKLLKDKDPWILAEEIPDSDIFFFQIPMSAFCSDTSYPFLKNYKKVLTHYKKFHMDFYMGEKDSNDVAESIIKAFLNRPGFVSGLNPKISEWSYKLIDYAKHTASLPLRDYSNRQLWELYAEHDRIHTKLYTYGWIPVAVDLLHNNFTKLLKSYLYGICENKEQAEAAFITLTTPSTKTVVAREREDFLKIYKKYKTSLRGGRASTANEAILSLNKRLLRPSAIRYNSDRPEFVERADALRPRNDAQLMKALAYHAANWGHLGYIYAGTAKPFGTEHYLKDMRDLAASGITAEKILLKEKRQLSNAKRQQEALYKKLSISKQYKGLFAAARDFALTKLIRRHAQLMDLRLLHASLLAEIAKRLGRTRAEVQCMLYGEVREALVNGKALSKQDLSTRFKECVLYTEKDFETIYSGSRLTGITKNLKRVFDKNQTELVGQTAQPGFARGAVKLIFRAKDISKMNKGDILVSIATDPDVVPAMKLAGAIITEQGGITSHAAIVSRELGIPCVIGTKIATKILKDGDMVEVDANNGTIKKL